MDPATATPASFATFKCETSLWCAQLLSETASYKRGNETNTSCDVSTTKVSNWSRATSFASEDGGCGEVG
jgi:hypothetical protein